MPAALAVMVAGLGLWRKRTSFDKFSTLANQGIIAIGIFLFFMQVQVYWHDSHPNDFAFPAENHKHIHEDRELEQLDKESGRENLQGRYLFGVYCAFVVDCRTS
jgi:hypothetical protein